jgi:hypothetical protein
MEKITADGQGTLKVKWKIPTPKTYRQDAVFYTGLDCIAEITLEQDGLDWSLLVYCDGETRYQDTQGNVYRNGPDLISAGYNTDKKLSRALEEEKLIHINNSWFDFYSMDGEHLDYVTHEIKEMIQGAESLLSEILVNGRYFGGEKSDGTFVPMYG